MKSLAIAPENCALGEGALEEVGRFAARFGHRAILFGGKTALELTHDRLLAQLARANVVSTLATFSGECSPQQIAKTTELFTGHDVAVCVGGGKAIDTGKAAAQEAGISCITVPTSAATCAACTALAIIHSDAGAYVTGRFLPSCPEAMIIDPLLIISAPARLLVSGIVDALARAWETELAARVRPLKLHAALSLAAGLGYAKSLLEESTSALVACQKKRVTEEFEHVVNACILGAGLASGLCDGFFRLNIAHAVSYGLTHFIQPENALHGETVGLGLLVQRLLEDPSGKSMHQLRSRLLEWNLPVRFTAVGLKLEAKAKGVVHALARKAHEFVDRENAVPFPVSEATLYEGIIAVEKASS